jgi:methionine-rich copper-binding protein CopC
MLTRVRETVLSLLPLGLGLTWTVGLMGLFGIRFTMGNVFALPLILGAAAEYGLNILLRFLEDGRQRGSILGLSTMQGVLVSGLTTITGFGSLMVADHRGIFGLGLLLTIGTAASLAAALVVLPVLLGRITGPAPPRRAGLASGALLSALLVLSPGVVDVSPVAAHAVIVEASLGEQALPPHRATAVRLKFNAALEPRFTRAALREPGGVERALVARGGTRREELVVDLPALEPGRYVLRYKVLAADGHLTEDIIRFSVAAAE